MKPQLTITKAGQGHGQAMRTALTMAALSGRAVKLAGIKDDRARPRPGLGPAGRTLLVALGIITGGGCQARGGDLEATFTPGLVRPGSYQFDVAREEPLCSPLSTVITPLILPLATCRESSSVLVSGATHMLGAPTTDELTRVILPLLRRLGVPVRLSEIAPGFFPQGGGEAELTVEPAGILESLKAEHSFQPHRIGAEVVISGLPRHLADQVLDGVVDRLGLFGLKPETSTRRAHGSTGMALLVWASSGRSWAGFSALGRPGGRPESLAIDASEAMLTFLNSGAGMQAEVAAQVLPTLACAQGISHISVDRLTPGLKATARVIETFWPDTVRIDTPLQGGPSQIRVMGRRWGRLS